MVKRPPVAAVNWAKRVNPPHNEEVVVNVRAFRTNGIELAAEAFGDPAHPPHTNDLLND